MPLPTTTTTTNRKGPARQASEAATSAAQAEFTAAGVNPAYARNWLKAYERKDHVSVILKQYISAKMSGAADLVLDKLLDDLVTAEQRVRSALSDETLSSGRLQATITTLMMLFDKCLLLRAGGLPASRYGGQGEGGSRQAVESTGQVIDVTPLLRRESQPSPGPG